MPQKLSFLHRSSVSTHEFEKQVRANEKIAGELARGLERPIRTAFEDELQRPADVLVEDALAAMRELLKDTPAIRSLVKPDGKESQRVKAALNGALLTKEDRARQEAGLQKEVAAAAKNLARHVTSLWVDELTGGNPKPGSPLRLNADMLPGKRSARDLVSKLDLSEFSISEQDVVGCWAEYRQAITDAAIDGNRPIEFGPHLYMYPDASLEKGEYRLFVDKSEAAAFVKKPGDLIDESPPLQPVVLESPFLRAYHAIREELEAPAAEIEDEEVEQVLACVKALRARRARQRPTGPALEAGNMARTMVFAMKRGLLEGQNRAASYLTNEKDAYTAKLQRIARDTNTDADVLCAAVGTAMVAAFRAKVKAKRMGRIRLRADRTNELFGDVADKAKRKLLTDVTVATFVRAQESIEA